MTAGSGFRVQGSGFSRKQEAGQMSEEL